MARLNTGWCTPGVHGPEVTGRKRRQREHSFTLRTAVRAWSSVMFLRFNSPLAHRSEGPGSMTRGLRRARGSRGGSAAGRRRRSTIGAWDERAARGRAGRGATVPSPCRHPRGARCSCCPRSRPRWPSGWWWGDRSPEVPGRRRRSTPPVSRARARRSSRPRLTPALRPGLGPALDPALGPVPR